MAQEEGRRLNKRIEHTGLSKGFYLSGRDDDGVFHSHGRRASCIEVSGLTWDSSNNVNRTMVKGVTMTADGLIFVFFIHLALNLSRRHINYRRAAFCN